MKKSIGFFLTILSAIASVVGIVAYAINSNTNYFVNLGMSPTVTGCCVAAIVLGLGYLAVTRKGYSMGCDILPVLPPVLMIVATVNLLSVRVNGIAAIMTFENNAENVADMTSAIVAIAACAVAAVIGILASFFDTVKQA